MESKQCSQDCFDKLFYKARSEHGFLDIPIDDSLLYKALEMTLLGPTAFNCSPLRIVFITDKNPVEKQKLLECIQVSNRQQTMECPVTAIVCYDTEFYNKMDQLYPSLDLKTWIVPDKTNRRTESVMLQNANIAAGYFILALRALNLGAGPMSGFDHDAIDNAFLSDTSWRSNFLINIGHADRTKRYVFPPYIVYTSLCFSYYI
jgi:3-hydroxypropanoate dehydrogenase